MGVQAHFSSSGRGVAIAISELLARLAVTPRPSIRKIRRARATQHELLGKHVFKI